MKLLKGVLSIIGLLLSIIAAYFIFSFIFKHPYKGAKKLAVNTVYSAMEDVPGVFFIKGWSHAEEQHRWTDGKIVELAFYFTDDMKNNPCEKMFLNLYPVMVIDSCQNLIIELNGEHLLNYKLCDFDSILSISLLKGVVYYDRTNHLAITIEKPMVPGELDKRSLGFAVNKFLIQCD